MATLTITNFLTAKRKQLTSKVESPRVPREANFAVLGLSACAQTFDYHPMLGCCCASSLLCSSRLLKCNGISVFWFFEPFAGRLQNQHRWFCRQKSPSPGPSVG